MGNETVLKTCYLAVVSLAVQLVKLQTFVLPVLGHGRGKEAFV